MGSENANGDSPFHGYMDNLVLSHLVTGTGGLVQLYTIDPGTGNQVPLSSSGNALTLDSNGHARVWLASTGVYSPDSDGEVIDFYFTASPTWRARIRMFGRRAVGFAKNVGKGLIGEGGGVAGGITDFATGMCAIGDVRDIAKNIAFMWPGGRSPDKFDLAMATLGFATEFAPVIGESADAPITAVKVIAKRIGTSPLREGIVGFGMKLLKSAKEDGFGAAMQQAIPFGKLLKSLALSSDEGLRAARLICDNGDEFLKYGSDLTNKLDPEMLPRLCQIVTSKGDDWADACRGAMKVLGESGDDVLATLKQGDGIAEGALEGLTKALKNGLDPELAKKILANPNIVSAGYTQVRLLTDVGKVADAPGFLKLADRLKINNIQAHGYRYELECAVALKESSCGTLEFISKIAEEWSDIDVVADGVYYQCKSTEAALKGVNDVDKWVKRAAATMKKETGVVDYSKIRYIVPDLTWITDDMRKYFEQMGMPFPLTIAHQ